MNIPGSYSGGVFKSGSYILEPLKEREHYISTKRNPENHGIGLHTVGKLVEKYGGVMKIEAGEEEFSVKIVFTVK